MATQPLRSVTPAIDIYIKLAQYPILADEIRMRMRKELYRRGVISQAEFEREVREMAIESQRREGVLEPYTHEEASVWALRQQRIRDLHTDAYFADNLGITLLEQLIQDVLRRQSSVEHTDNLTFNPEIAPWELLFQQGELYESRPVPERKEVEHHLQEIKVVLIKRMISDQLMFIAVAKNILTIADLRRVYRRLIGGGKIGGKAAGIVLAWKILQQQDPDLGPDISKRISIPDSYFIGSEVIYEFSVLNRFDHFMNQKYRPIDEIRKEYPRIVQAYLQGKLPESVVDRLREILFKFKGIPLIVRSSSLLEDNFGFSFAGKYASIFCPNQGSDKENLHDLLNAIRRVYASLLNPDALLYRRKNNLLDYDERMCVIIQPVKGQQYGSYYFPTVAGVAFSHNPFRWSPKIRREDGFLRMVWGLGTRAVNRVANDYPRLVALSHPQLQPDPSPQAIRHFSQMLVDLIDLEENRFKTLPVDEVLGPYYPNIQVIASEDKQDYLQDIFAAGMLSNNDQFILTFNRLVKDERFIKLMRTALMRLERAYGRPVDVEFTIEILQKKSYLDYRLHILQCRPLSQRVADIGVTIPENIPQENKLFTSNWLVPYGKVENVRYIVFVDPNQYTHIKDIATKREIGRAIGRLNQLLKEERFILMGPGRWGSANIDLGVHVTYADIYHTCALVEIALIRENKRPEMSHGTHFFQDLVETGIYALALWADGKHGNISLDYFRQSDSCLSDVSPEDSRLEPYLRLIDVPAVSSDQFLQIYMDGSHEQAVGFLAVKTHD
ncbi:MAG: PEP/pyruvate-binding domain-containing protein [Candidatus Promineifilaceae bacterium]|nr:PEP/pyruvate-binding domain-containing protein [Candidatus Promineifilaceae bacterium]